MIVTNELVRKVAHLAKLEFRDEELTAIREDLQQMISFVEKLNELDTTGVEPLLHMSACHDVLREDRVEHPVTREQALINAPRHDGQYFLVPKVIERDVQ